jgi:hypothetical protein
LASDGDDRNVIFLPELLCYLRDLGSRPRCEFLCALEPEQIMFAVPRLDHTI